MAIEIDIAATGSLGGVGQRITGGAAGQQLGFSVTGAGDVNGDGIADLALASGGGTGNAFIVFGGTNAFASVIDVTSLGTAGVTLQTTAAQSVAILGDVNNDGIADIAVGAPLNNGYAGQAFVVFGDAGLSGTVDLSSLGAGGFAIAGPEANARAGFAVASAGDVDNDGIPDILVGSPTGSLAVAARTYLIYGDGSLGADIDLATTYGTRFYGSGFGGSPTNNDLGRAVAGGGDINGDGIDDILIGAPDNGAANYGIVPVIFGSNALAATIDVDNLGAAGFVAAAGSRQAAGRDVAIVGDVNGDGTDDFIIGAPYNVAQNRGSAYLIFGDAGLGADIDLDNLGAAGIRIDGLANQDLLGRAVAGIGDFNNDGIEDFAIGSPSGTGLGSKVYIVFGRNDFSGGVDLSALGDDEGVIINSPQSQDGFGTDVAGVGDVNNDGFADILIGAPQFIVDAANNGEAYVIFGFTGAAQNLTGSGDADTLTGSSGDDTIAGDAGDDLLIAGSGDDEITGDAGDDRAYGQSGNDTVSGGEGDDSLFGNLGDDEITGGPNNDMIRAHVGGDLVAGDAGDDNLFGGGGDDTMTGGGGNDTLGGNSGADMVSGNDGNDTVRGQAGNDTLNGNDGDDLVIGMQGNDMLFGGAGNDTLIGGEANDTLTGGAGVDAFVFAATQGADVIADFEDGTDVISLVGVANFAALTIVDTADGARITFEATPTTAITVTGINANQLTAADFFFS